MEIQVAGLKLSIIKVLKHLDTGFGSAMNKTVDCKSEDCRFKSCQ